MTNLYTTYFNEKKLIIKSRLKLKDYTALLVDVCTSMVKIATSSESYFNHFNPMLVEQIQSLICQYCIFENEDGEQSDVTLADLIQSNDCFILLMVEFLEFNYGIFSNAKRMLEILSTDISRDKSSKKVSYGGKTVVFKSRLKMHDTCLLLPLACDAMVRLATGEDKFLSKISISEVEMIQGYICQYSVVKQDDGKEKPLNLLDLNNGIKDFIILLCEFLEFNYGIFSQAQLMTAVMIGQNSEQAA